MFIQCTIQGLHSTMSGLTLMNIDSTLEGSSTFNLTQGSFDIPEIHKLTTTKLCQPKQSTKCESVVYYTCIYAQPHWLSVAPANLRQPIRFPNETWTVSSGTKSLPTRKHFSSLEVLPFFSLLKNTFNEKCQKHKKMVCVCRKRRQGLKT